ncbi:ubiquitin carboxyl-terminal hydrolase 28 isoform X3 [Anolis carolinensis]|uniref:ubiquitinyl hydrolase 1 n=1 Tax=Anolis carolinensis TaxID=28377 RepID=A0A803ST76_ANOCA|nr:PREDICTED: ubiquitin carboxyl-terminal hydrolase 28 isoform X3 [Anolis carolinensis]|eukprot:XP_016852170.1 PREDICTED: ubiquitin carboxyl-terminal hydrolase 28 isoform X3 [Anolis carolinensis]
MTAARPEGEAACGGSPAPNSSVLINQLREITGIQDPLFLHEALKAANGNLVQAVGFLSEAHAKESSQEGTATEASYGGRSVLVLEQAAVGVTQDDGASLQEGIPSDVQDFQGAQVTDQDPNAAVNEPCVCDVTENTNRSKRKRCEVWGEQTTLNDWRRNGEWPVGLKNIGNTCWFSAVIQSLFQLPEFRRLVLSYTPDSGSDNCCSRSKKRNIAFMLELQCLFALMLGTRRKFVDPTAALELLRGAFRSPEEQQQDVSEFTHKLLDWLEDAFQLAANVNSQNKSENPMVQLFYGTFLSEGIHEGKAFSKIETFGQYPLQVNGYKDLQECLEGAILEKETEASSSSQSVQYRQERWFTKLPPVLTFELSRFEFNQSLGQPEKIHNKLEFPQVVYMDRFLYSNKGLIQAKREEIKRLKEQITVLQQKLEQYMRYGSGAGRFPLLDMLQYVLEFASSRPLTANTEASTESQISKPPFIQSRVTVTPSEGGDEASASQAASPPEEASGPLRSSTPPVEMPESPAPHGITEEEVHLVMTCLQRWRREVEQDINDLKDSIALLSASVDQMYCDPRLQQVPYHLHAVLVHEGQANAGHYWAYIYHQPRKCWLKYNDVSVTESSWEELERDSFGGLRNASAYCLMYINKKLPHFAVDYDDGQTQAEVEALPLGLKQHIQADNWQLEQEVAEWEEQASKMAQIDQSSSSIESQYLSSDSGQEDSSPSDSRVGLLSSQHATIAKAQTALAIDKAADAFNKDGVEAAYNQSTEVETAKADPEEASLPVQVEEEQEVATGEHPTPPSSQLSEVEIPSVGRILVRSDADGYNEEAFREEYARLYALSTEEPTPQNDPRLQHVLIYLLQNKAPQQVVERTLLEQFADKNLSYDERSISIMQVARAKLKEIGPNEMDMEEYKKWHEDYSLFRKVSLYLLTGLEFYQNKQYCEALTYLIHACENNLALQKKGPKRGADGALIALYRRKCLLKLNDMAAALLDSNKDLDVGEGLGLLGEVIIPCVHIIAKHNLSQDDLEAIELMRGGWCDYMVKVMDEELQLKLNELLSRLFDCSSEGLILKEPPKIRPNSPYDLCSRFAAVMESIHGASPVTVK